MSPLPPQTHTTPTPENPHCHSVGNSNTTAEVGDPVRTPDSPKPLRPHGGTERTGGLGQRGRRVREANKNININKNKYFRPSPALPTPWHQQGNQGAWEVPQVVLRNGSRLVGRLCLDSRHCDFRKLRRPKHFRRSARHRRAPQRHVVITSRR